MKILVIEDQENILMSIKDALVKESFVCEVAVDFYEAEEKIALYQYDVAVVDINLPGGSGLDLIKKIKGLSSTTGIIVLSARNSIDNKIEGLELGADDYLTKPFNMGELIARIKSIIRRKKFGGTNTITFEEFKLNVDLRQVVIHEKTVDLTKSEFDILLFFIANSDRVLTKENIAEHIFGDNIDMIDSFDFIYSHIKNLRKKIAQADGGNYLKAVYGIGYKWTLDQ